jgi:hypothetical protein
LNQVGCRNGKEARNFLPLAKVGQAKKTNKSGLKQVTIIRCKAARFNKFTQIGKSWECQENKTGLK